MRLPFSPATTSPHTEYQIVPSSLVFGLGVINGLLEVPNNLVEEDFLKWPCIFDMYNHPLKYFKIVKIFILLLQKLCKNIS